jgi:hypothetical protein
VRGTEAKVARGDHAGKQKEQKTHSPPDQGYQKNLEKARVSYPANEVGQGPCPCLEISFKNISIDPLEGTDRAKKASVKHRNINVF